MSPKPSADALPERLRREAEAGARAPYDDPADYDSTYANRIDDVTFYVERAIESAGPVLELGAGNGRITLPIARHGVEVTAVDCSKPMVSDLEARLRTEAPGVRSRVRVKRGDIRNVRLRKRFALVICPFNTALHLYTRPDVERFLSTVRAHLGPKGRLLVDLSIPQMDDLARDPSRAFGLPPFRHPSTGRVVRYREYFDYDPIAQLLVVSMQYTPRDDPSGGWVVPLAHRQFFPREWEALLHYNGFDTTRVWGGFLGEPLDRQSDTMVWEARVKKRSR